MAKNIFLRDDTVCEKSLALVFLDLSQEYNPKQCKRLSSSCLLLIHGYQCAHACDTACEHPVFCTLSAHGESDAAGVLACIPLE